MLFLPPRGAVSSEVVDGTRPIIVDAKIYVGGEFLRSDLKSSGLFSQQIRGTIESGLPAVVELLFRLVANSKTVDQGILAYELGHDVWEDHYTIRGVDSTRFFPSMSQMSSTIEQLRRIAIVPIRDLEPESQYHLQFMITVHPLRGREQRKIAGWVDETVRGEERGSWRRQVLNLNDLINHFFSREKDVTNRSDWFLTRTFKPALLPRLEREGE